MDRVDGRKGLPRIGVATFGWPFAIAGAAVALILPVIVLLSLGSAGADSRVPGPSSGQPIPSIVTTSGPAAVLAMEDAGVHGVRVVQASRDFGYRVDMLGEALASDVNTATNTPESATDLFRARINTENYLYVATRLGVVRSVSHLMTPAAFEAKVTEGRDSGMPGIAADGKSVSVNQDGDLREIYPRFPGGPGDVALFVNASYFIDGTEAELVSNFESSGTHVVLVVASWDDDIPDVTPGARARLKSFLQDVEEGLLE